MASYASGDATATKKKADSPSRFLTGFSGGGDIGAPAKKKKPIASSSSYSRANDPPRGQSRSAVRSRGAGAAGGGAPSSSTVRSTAPRGRTSSSYPSPPPASRVASESSYTGAAPVGPPEETPEPYQYGEPIPGPYPGAGPAPPLPERAPGQPPDSRSIFTDRRVPVGHNFGPPGGGYRGDPYQGPAYAPYPPADPSIPPAVDSGRPDPRDRLLRRQVL